MKLKLLAALMLVCALFVCASYAAEPAKFHIGIMTGTVSQSEDDLRGAELMIAKYGDAKDGGMITHITYPDNFPSEQETTISQIVGLADDPLMKVIVVNQAVPGTAEGFRRVREKRSDILLLAGEPHEDPGVILRLTLTTSDAATRFLSERRRWELIRSCTSHSPVI